MRWDNPVDVKICNYLYTDSYLISPNSAKSDLFASSDKLQFFVRSFWLCRVKQRLYFNQIFNLVREHFVFTSLSLYCLHSDRFCISEQTNCSFYCRQLNYCRRMRLVRWRIARGAPRKFFTLLEIDFTPIFPLYFVRRFLVSCFDEFNKTKFFLF